MPMDEDHWSLMRAQIARDPSKVNLNAGTLSPTPLPVVEAVTRLRAQMAANPSDFLWRRAAPLLQGSRARLATYLNCRPAELLLLPNTTFAINLIVSSLNLPPGSEILTTDHEYGAMMFCWRRAAERAGWILRQTELPYLAEDPQQIVDAFEGAISTHTRVMYFSHVTTSTGLVLPADALAELARRRGLLCIIDGAHAPGMVPVDLEQIGADFYTANCHKWLMAPAGAGFLHVAESRREVLQSLITSWGWDYDRSKPHADSGWGGSHWQLDMEFHGTVDRCPQMVFPEALDFRVQLGGDAAIHQRTHELGQAARDLLGQAGLTRATPTNPQLSGAMQAFDFPCDDVIAMRDRLYNEFDVECPITTAAKKTFIRVSAAWFVTVDELERLARAVAQIRRA